MPTPWVLSNGEIMDSDFEYQSHEPPTQIEERYTYTLILYPQLETIEDFVIIKL